MQWKVKLFRLFLVIQVVARTELLSAMKINPAAQNLSLVLKALDTVISPDLSSATARDTLTLIQTSLKDLLQRQRNGPATLLLRRCIVSGEALEVRMRDSLGDVALALSNQCRCDEVDFEALAEQHERLTLRINELCVRLSRVSDNEHNASLLRSAAEWELEYYKGLPQLQAKPFGDGPNGPPQVAAPELSREFLESFLIQKHGQLEITAFSSLSGGYGGKQTYLSTLKHSDGRVEEIVVRKCDPVPAITHRTFRLEQEFDMLQSLSKTSYPSPHPIDLASNVEGVDGTFFTMPRLPGSIPGTFLEGHQQKLPEKCLFRLAELLADLHAIPLNIFEDYISKYDGAAAMNDTIEERYRSNLQSWRAYAQDVEHPASPFITWLFDWLERNIPIDSRPPVLTHGDFNFHNVLVDDDNNITAVLDWECSDFGAPEQDLAYIKPHISKHMEWELFMDHYLKSGGQEINTAHMPFCAAYSVMRIFLAGNRSSMNIQRGVNRDVRYVMMELGFAGMLMQFGLGCTNESAGKK